MRDIWPSLPPLPSPREYPWARRVPRYLRLLRRQCYVWPLEQAIAATAGAWPNFSGIPERSPTFYHAMQATRYNQAYHFPQEFRPIRGDVWRIESIIHSFAFGAATHQHTRQARFLQLWFPPDPDERSVRYSFYLGVRWLRRWLAGMGAATPFTYSVGPYHSRRVASDPRARNARVPLSLWLSAKPWLTVTTWPARAHRRRLILTRKRP